MKTSKKKLPKYYTANSIRLLKNRFLKKDPKRNKKEHPSDLFHRVAKWVASADKNYTKSKTKIKKAEEEFFNVLYNLLLVPQSPTLLNSGKKNKTLSACFVLPIEDSLDAIYKTLSDAVQVQWKGGGTGFNFSKIRPKGDEAGGMPDVAAGPIHFIKTFSEALMGVRQGGKRGGANIAILNVDHPDIIDFIHMKEKDRTIVNFNISVGITDKFMKAFQNDHEYELINPRNNKCVKKISARYVFNEIIDLAYRTADPGIAFIDNINKDNPTPHLGVINSTNPCGEQPLLSYESCNLAALNLFTHFDYRTNDINWSKLKNTINTAVHFLDNIIDINYYPLKKIEEITKFKNRKMGLGLMGFADVLIVKEIPYNSQKAVDYAEKVMEFIQKESIQASINLAKKRSTFPAYKGSVWEKKKLPVRNATITTIAPNGNTSIIGGVTGGIEPVFDLVYKIGGIEDNNYKATTIFTHINQAFKYIAKKNNFYSKDLIEKLSKNVPISEIEEIPDRFKKVFVTSPKIEPKWHLLMQAAFQKHVDNAISKTINFPNNATRNDIRKVFIDAYRNNLKGVTIYRDGCKYAQTYVSSKKGKLNTKEEDRNRTQFVIANKDKFIKKGLISDLGNFNGKIKISNKQFTLPNDEEISYNLNENTLLKISKENSKSAAEQSQSIAISEKNGFLIKSKTIKPKDILFFGKKNDFSSNLFKKLLSHINKKGTKAYISTAISIYDPFNEKFISTTTKIPGKLVKTTKNKYMFLHKGINSFSETPSEIEFRSYNPRYKALQKVFENFNIYKKDSIEVSLSQNAHEVLKRRSLKKNKKGKIIETPEEMFKRIAKYISKAGTKYNYSKSEIDKSYRNFYNILNKLEFQCGGALIWAGMSDKKGKKAIWSKCFVLPIEDSIRDIFDTLNNNIEVLKHGGGTGFNFSKIRSSYSKVSTTGEHAAGPVEYLKVFNNAQDTIVGRGGRQMGSMAILNIDHPNIPEFITSKREDNKLTHYNISVGITDKFMKHINRNKKWKLVDPHDKKIYKTLNAKKLFHKICKYAWQSGDPGLIFLDQLDKDNPTKHLGKIVATNVCGEQPLLFYESCNLGNINLSKIVKNFPYLKNPNIGKKSLRHKIKYIDWDKFERIINTSIEFLDNIIDINNYPIKEIEKMTKKTRSIGLGLMGFADLLIKLGIPYDSKDAIKLSSKIMKFLQEKSHKASIDLAKKRGNFPAFKGSKWDKSKKKYMRNSRCTTIAPTGTISIVVQCNPGIEPIFALVYKRMQSLGGKEQTVVNFLFEKIAKNRGFYSDNLMKKLSEGKKLSEIKNVPSDVIDIFKTSHEIDPEQHVRVQSAFQKYCDSGVSKTINLPKSSTINDIKDIFKLSHKLKCKGITIFRDGCKSEAQKINISEEKDTKETISKTPRERPLITRGITTQVKTEQGSLYVTINEDENGIAEVFLNIGKSGGYSSGYCEAIGRLISVSLRAGLSIESIIDQLKGIRTSIPTLNKGMFVYSVPDAVAKVLENHIKNKNISMFKKTEKIKIKNEKEIKEEAELSKPERENKPKKKNNDSKYSNENTYDQLPECPECGGDLQYAEGCMVCLSCGYSKCG